MMPKLAAAIVMAEPAKKVLEESGEHG